MMRCLLVDDEAPARQRLRRLLEETGRAEVLGEAGDGVSALEAVERFRPGVLFLDIDMPELDGLGVAAALPAQGPAVVFTTAYDEHALKAFELAAVDYLLKPVTKARLQGALDRLQTRLPKPGDLEALAAQWSGLRPLRRMAVRSHGKYTVFDPERVSAIVARDHYSAILVDGQELLSEDSLDKLGAQLDAERFVRVHRAGIIHLAFLRELVHEGDRLYVAVLDDPDRTRVPVSRERLGALKAKLGL